MKRIAMLLIMLPPLALTPPTITQASPPDLTGLGYVQKLGERLPLDIVLRDESGDRVTLGTALGRHPAIVLLGYFRCRKLCGVLRAETLDALAASRLAAGRDYNFVAISVDPSETHADAAAAKAKDIKDFPAAGAETGWRYLTGGTAEIAEISRAVGFEYSFNAERQAFAHPIGRVLVDPDGLVSSYLFGFGVEASSVRSAIARAAADVLAAPATPFALFCFDYDAATGRYTLSVMRTLRLLCGASALAFAVFLGAAFRRRRAK